MDVKTIVKKGIRKVGLDNVVWAAWHRSLAVLSAIKKQIYRFHLKRFLTRASLPHQSQSVLIVLNRGGVGNVIEATPFIQALRSCWPKSNITLLTPHKELFENWCIIDDIATDIQQLHNHTFDYTFFPYWEWTELPNWNISISWGHVFMPGWLIPKWFLKPEWEDYLSLAKTAAGYKGSIPPFYVSLKQPSSPLLEANAFRITIAPGGKRDLRWKGKKWPYYSELVEALLKHYPGIQICIVGTSEDDIVLTKDNPEVIDLRDKLTLSETAWLIKHSYLTIGNDSGPMHLADAVQARSIVIFGCTCPIKNTYRNKVLIITPDASCFPCQYDLSLLDHCTSHQCIRSISVETVMETVSAQCPR